MEVAISIEGNWGLTWSRWIRLLTEIENFGFSGLFCSDHFSVMDSLDNDSLELIVALTYLATHNPKTHFGSLVSPLTFRDPIILSRKAMALNEISGGRMILGIGAGWTREEHQRFGYSFGNISTRLDRLEEGLEVITSLMRGDGPVSFDGRFYLKKAKLLPQSRTPILIGGNGPNRLLKLVARYADIWNCRDISPRIFKEKSNILDYWLKQEGRNSKSIKRTLLIPVACWRNQDDLEKRVKLLKASSSQFINMSAADIISTSRKGKTSLMLDDVSRAP